MVAFNAALGAVATSTSASQTQLTWIVDGYTVVLACLLLPAGAISDRYGRRAALVGGLLLFAAASAAPIVFAAPNQIIAARMVAGAGAALVMPATLSLLSLAYPRHERAKAIGIWAGVAGCAGVMGMVGSGVLLEFWDWPAICWSFGVAAVLLMAAACTIAPSRDDEAPAVDWLGAVLVAAAIAVMVVGLLGAPHRGWSHPVTIGCVAASLALGTVFAAAQLRRRTPLVDVRLFGDRRFAAGVVSIMVLFAATFGFFYLTMQYLQLILGYSPLMTSVAFAPFLVPVVGLSAVSFRYAPRLGLRLVASGGMTLIAAGFFTVLALQRDSSYLRPAISVLVIGAGIGLCTAPATSAIMSAVGDERQGIGSAINDAAREIGAAVGIALAGSVLSERYTHAVAVRLTGWPDAVRVPASDSLGNAMRTAQFVGPQASSLAVEAQGAFITAMHFSAVIMAAMAIAAAIFLMCRAPDRAPD